MPVGHYSVYRRERYGGKLIRAAKKLRTRLRGGTLLQQAIADLTSIMVGAFVGSAQRSVEGTAADARKSHVLDAPACAKQPA